jgi:hypothetical protein
VAKNHIANWDLGFFAMPARFSGARRCAQIEFEAPMVHMNLDRISICQWCRSAYAEAHTPPYGTPDDDPPDFHKRF